MSPVHGYMFIMNAEARYSISKSIVVYLPTLSYLKYTLFQWYWILNTIFKYTKIGDPTKQSGCEWQYICIDASHYEGLFEHMCVFMNINECLCLYWCLCVNAYAFIFMHLCWLLGWLVGFYCISTILGYLTPNPFFT